MNVVYLGEVLDFSYVYIRNFLWSLFNTYHYQHLLHHYAMCKYLIFAGDKSELGYFTWQSEQDGYKQLVDVIINLIISCVVSSAFASLCLL